MILRDAALLQAVLDSRLLDVHTSMPGQVTKWHADTKTVDVQPMIKHVLKDPDGTEYVESYPILPNIRVAWPRFGGFIVAGALAVGDFVTVIFDEWSCDRFRQQNSEVHPVDLARHALTSALAYPGGADPASGVTSEDLEGCLVIGKEGGSVIRFKSSGIEIGVSGDTLDSLALATNTENRLAALEQFALTHIHGFTSPSGPVLAATPPPVLNTPPAPVASSEVKAK